MASVSSNGIFGSKVTICTSTVVGMFGSVEPYDYASSHVTEMLVNQRKVEFLKKFEDELYNDAIRSGDVEFHSEP